VLETDFVSTLLITGRGWRWAGWETMGWRVARYPATNVEPDPWGLPEQWGILVFGLRGTIFLVHLPAGGTDAAASTESFAHRRYAGSSCALGWCDG
jgi:hypothetical protein